MGPAKAIAELLGRIAAELLLGRALRQAVAIEPGKENEIPSTKGLLV